MAATCPAKEPTKAGGRLRRRAAAGGVALGVSSVLGIGGFASPAAAQTPTAFSTCDAAGQLSGRITDFPANSTFRWFARLRWADGSISRLGFSISTDATGAGTLGGSLPVRTLPLQVDFDVYNDLNGNNHWDPGTDDTIYAGNGTLTTCPSEVMLSPK